ncbi:TIGR03085 family metal-binding protein [Actinoallomurus bryophytorum]|nr:TIGR03085 family metal-binding protein [Actinoallomurus bryophytorum]
MADQNWAQIERQALCDLLIETGPDAPTLCEGWTTGDLAAHLLIRERRPDAAAGAMLPFLEGYSERVRRQALERTPFPQLVELIRQGPPTLSLFGLPGVDGLANTVEFFVHHEDARRGLPGREPRRPPAELEELLWRRLKMGRFALRRLPVEITMAEPGGRTQRLTKGGPQVRVHGLPSELTLWTMGRKEAARVELTGEADAVNLLSQSRWAV